MILVRETKAGQSISAYIIFDKKRQYVATVQAYFGDSGCVTVNVWDTKEINVQIGRAGGYGYDKFTAALTGLTIDGIKLNNHCGQDKRTKKILKDYHANKISRDQAVEKAKKIGAGLANWDNNKQQWQSIHLLAGMEKLRLLGYTVIQAI